MSERQKQTGCPEERSGLCCTKIEHLSVTLGSSKILRDVNLHIHCGELTAIIGPNGAGKSTLLKAILGEIKHTGKLSYLDEKGLHTDSPVIGYVPQHLSFDKTNPVSVYDLFVAAQSKAPAWLPIPYSQRKRVKKSLAVAKGEHLIDRTLGALSGGELQRVLLALALDPVPDLLLLDEPVSGIDQKGLELFYNMVSKLRSEFDLSIILVSHDLDLVSRYADRVILLNGSVLVSGTPDEVFSDSKTIKQFGLSWYEKRNSSKKDKNRREDKHDGSDL